MNKIIALTEAASQVPDGATISLGGFTTQRHPMAFIYELIRLKRRDLYLFGHSPGGDWDILIGAGCVKRVELAYEADEAFNTIDAESLLGRGDMLFLPPEASAPLRVQGALVIDQEVERIITFWQKHLHTPGAAEPPPWEEIIAAEQVLSDHDGLVQKAILLVRQERRTSTSLLQRWLHIGYPRAARLIDELEELGVVGPTVGGGREREVLTEQDDEEDEPPER